MKSSFYSFYIFKKDGHAFLILYPHASERSSEENGKPLRGIIRLI